MGEIHVSTPEEFFKILLVVEVVERVFGSVIEGVVDEVWPQVWVAEVLVQVYRQKLVGRQFLFAGNP